MRRGADNGLRKWLADGVECGVERKRRRRGSDRMPACTRLEARQRGKGHEELERSDEPDAEANAGTIAPQRERDKPGDERNERRLPEMIRQARDHFSSSLPQSLR